VSGSNYIKKNLLWLQNEKGLEDWCNGRPVRESMEVMEMS
jgi:hypothetical protein